MDPASAEEGRDKKNEQKNRQRRKLRTGGGTQPARTGSYCTSHCSKRSPHCSRPASLPKNMACNTEVRQPARCHPRPAGRAGADHLKTTRFLKSKKTKQTKRRKKKSFPTSPSLSPSRGPEACGVGAGGGWGDPRPSARGDGLAPPTWASQAWSCTALWWISQSYMRTLAHAHAHTHCGLQERGVRRPAPGPLSLGPRLLCAVSGRGAWRRARRPALHCGRQPRDATHLPGHLSPH